MKFPDKTLVSQPGQSRKLLYGEAVTRRGGGIEHAAEFGTNLTMRSLAPPPVEEYDRWLKQGNRRGRESNFSTPKTGFRLRRIVIMRRQGSTWKECADAVGVSPGVAKDWVEFLPPELAV